MVCVVCPVSETDLTENFDRVFWLGDFNFRVTLERSQVNGMLEKYKDQHNPHCKVSLNHLLCFFFFLSLKNQECLRNSLPDFDHQRELFSLPS